MCNAWCFNKNSYFIIPLVLTIVSVPFSTSLPLYLTGTPLSHICVSLLCGPVSWGNVGEWNWGVIMGYQEELSVPCTPVIYEHSSLMFDLLTLH